MIRYSLTCDAAHSFESWFPSAGGFEDQLARGLVQCAVCGSGQVEKALMAPSVRVGRKAAEAAPAAERPLTEAQNPAEAALMALKREIEANSDYVGMNFASEARRIHAGNAPERAIHGEAKPEEARKLIEDGVPVAPLPFMPSRKAN